MIDDATSQWQQQSSAAPSYRPKNSSSCTCGSPSEDAPAQTKNNDVPFGIGKELIVGILMNPRGIRDIYINDMIPLMVDIPGTNNLARCAAAGLLAIHATAQPMHPKEQGTS
jgi:hypothetical protein